MNRKAAFNNGVNCKHDGCTHKFLLKLLKHHEALCEYGTQMCPVYHCSVSIKLNEVKQHSLTSHSNIVVRNPHFVLNYNKFKENFLNDTFEGLRYTNSILFYYDEVFQGEFSYSKSSGFMRWGVNYLDKRRDLKFYFMLSFINHKDVYMESCMPFYKDDFTDSIGCNISLDKMISYCDANGDLGVVIEIHAGAVSRFGGKIHKMKSSELLEMCLNVEKFNKHTNTKDKIINNLNVVEPLSKLKITDNDSAVDGKNAKSKKGNGNTAKGVLKNTTYFKKSAKNKKK